MKKAQIEIIGFVIIILLLLFSLIFYFSFSSNERTDLLAEAEENLEVSNMLEAIKLYTVQDCDGEQLGDIIKECVDNGFACGEDACAVVAREVPLLVSYNGWTEEEYMFFIGETMYSETECVGNTFVDEYLASGETVKLVFCYS